MKHIGRIYMGIIFAIMYLPLLVMVIFSFNESNSTAKFTGFSLYWYEEMLNDTAAMEALQNTLVLALCTTAIATVLGTVIQMLIMCAHFSVRLRLLASIICAINGSEQACFP